MSKPEIGAISIEDIDLEGVDVTITRDYERVGAGRLNWPDGGRMEKPRVGMTSEGRVVVIKPCGGYEGDQDKWPSAVEIKNIPVTAGERQKRGIEVIPPAIAVPLGEYLAGDRALKSYTVTFEEGLPSLRRDDN